MPGQDVTEPHEGRAGAGLAEGCGECRKLICVHVRLTLPLPIIRRVNVSATDSEQQHIVHFRLTRLGARLGLGNTQHILVCST